MFTILDRNNLGVLANQIVTNTKFDETAFQWEHIDKLVHRLKQNLRPIFLMVDFSDPSIMIH